jgi:hypothetical protein
MLTRVRAAKFAMFSRVPAWRPRFDWRDNACHGKAERVRMMPCRDLNTLSGRELRAGRVLKLDGRWCSPNDSSVYLDQESFSDKRCT